MTVETYLTPARAPAPLEHVGPRSACPFCSCTGTVLDRGTRHEQRNPLSTFVRACRGAPWWRRLFGGCRRRDAHLHQWCPRCRGRWDCAPSSGALA